MHELACDPTKWREWWPQGQPAEVDLTTLPVAGAITSPLRLVGDGDWLAVWGNFQGLRWGFRVAETFQIFSGTVTAMPRGVDLYLSIDTGGTGVASFGMFKTKEAAMAWCSSKSSATGKIPLPPGGVYTPSDAQANPAALSGVESFPMLWNTSTALWERARALPQAANGREKVEDSYLAPLTNTSINTLTVASTSIYTAPAGKVATVYVSLFVQAFTAAATLDVLRSGGQLDRYVTAAVGNLARNIGPILLAPAQTVDISVTVGGAGTLLATPMIEERWSE